MANTLKVAKVASILELHAQGWSQYRKPDTLTFLREVRKLGKTLKSLGSPVDAVYLEN
jgi:hypothetical protein